MEFVSSDGPADWSSYVLMVPVISVGNVGQLAADLLISTLQLRRAGVLHHAALLPAVGAAAFAHAPGLTHGLELFFDPERRLACLQQRAPAAPGLQAELARTTATWVARAGFRQVWVLGSLDAVFRVDGQLAGSQLRFWSRSGELASACSGCGVPALEEGWFQDKPLEQRLLPPWPLLLALEGEGVPCAALLAFCLEGDNRPDAHALAGAAAGVLGLQQAGRAQADGPPVGEAAPASASVGLTWLPPASWQHAFGSASRPLLY